MRIAFPEVANLELTLAGDPDIVDRMVPEDSQRRIVWSTDPYKLAKQLEETAAWVRRMHIRYPTDYVDCIIENEV